MSSLATFCDFRRFLRQNNKNPSISVPSIHHSRITPPSTEQFTILGMFSAPCIRIPGGATLPVVVSVLNPEHSFFQHVVFPKITRCFFPPTRCLFFFVHNPGRARSQRAPCPGVASTNLTAVCSPAPFPSPLSLQNSWFCSSRNRFFQIAQQEDSHLCSTGIIVRRFIWTEAALQPEADRF